MSEQGQGGKVLVIERYPYGIRLYINGSEESYFIKDSDKKGWYVFVIERDREMVDVTEDRYENLGVKDLDELYHGLIGFPTEYYEMLTGEKVNFSYLININDYKFEVCRVDASEDGSPERDLTELIECYSVHKDEKRIDYDNYATFPPDWVLTLDVDYNFDELLQKALEDPEQGIKEIEKYIEW
jgi:hypothetical protein